METISILGASVRAAAFSALRAGLRPWCADLFADTDLRKYAPCVRIALDDFPWRIPSLLQRSPAAPWVYVGGLENYPSVVRKMAKQRLSWGNDSRVLIKSRSPAFIEKVLRARGLSCPRASLTPPKTAPHLTWLRKPIRSAGGKGIAFWTGGTADATPHVGYYWQEYIPGDAISAAYMGNGISARFLGVTSQWVGQPWLYAGPFQYCGSFGPLTLPPATVTQLQTMGDALAAACGLRGLFGVDCILCDGTPWPVEINPRYTAGMEVLEYGFRSSMLAWHRSAFDPSSSHPGKLHLADRFVGKAILFAKSPFLFPADGPWRSASEPGLTTDWVPPFADIPAPGEVMAAGQPIMSLMVEANSEHECLNQLQEIVASLEKRFYSQAVSHRSPHVESPT